MSHCAVCQHQSSKTILYVCQYGHIMCQNCRSNKSRHHNGDCMKCSKKHSKIKHDNKKESSKDVVRNEDLASGDTINTIKGAGGKQNTINKKVTETSKVVVVKYKNKDYRGNQSSISTTSMIHQSDESKQNKYEYNLLPRPIPCPECSKIITINSILQHFCFEHPTVPKFILKYPTTLHTIIKFTDLVMEPNCKAVIIVEKESRFTELKSSEKGKDVVEEYKEQQHSRAKSALLLMAAYLDSKNFNKTTVEYKEEDKDETVEEPTIVQNQLYRKETDVILWLSKTTDDEIIYNLLISKEDKKLSYSFTGKAIHLRDRQSPQQVYQQAGCIIISGIAVGKMVNIYGHIHVYITVFL